VVRALGLLVFIVAAAGGAIVLSGGKDDSGRTRSPHAAGGAKDLTDAPCSSGGQSAATRASSRRDVVLGPLVLLGGGEWAASEPDAFNGHGYKVPVTLPGGVQATLSVPKSLRGRVGLVFSMPAQDRVVRRGVRGADASVRFTACPAAGAPRRTGWAGGLVVDRRRCATLVVTVAGGSSVRRRVPLGRRC